MVIPNAQDTANFLSCSICYAVCFLKSNKIDACDNKETKESIGSDLYNQLNEEKECLQLDLDYRKFKKISLIINEILSRHVFFQRLFELRQKFHYPLKKNTEKETMRKKCLVVLKKSMAPNMVSLEFGKKLREKFKHVEFKKKIKPTAIFQKSYI